VKEHRIELGEGNTTVRIEMDEFKCMEICPMFHNGFCRAFDVELQSINRKYFRCSKCVDSELA